MFHSAEECANQPRHNARLLVNLFVSVLLLSFAQSASAAILDFLGIGLSDTTVYKEVEHWLDPITGTLELKKPGELSKPGKILILVNTAIKIIDPPALDLLSGRVTIGFDPHEMVTGAGWYGEFGADPTLPSPAIGGDPDVSQLQFAANPAMASNSILIDQAGGRAVFNFDWGPKGFVPTKNLDATGHFNFAGLYIVPTSATTTAQVMGTGPTTSAATFLVCTSPEGGGTGTCGSSIPEPSNSSVMALGCIALGFAFRLRIAGVIRKRVTGSPDP